MSDYMLIIKKKNHQFYLRNKDLKERIVEWCAKVSKKYLENYFRDFIKFHNMIGRLKFSH